MRIFADMYKNPCESAQSARIRGLLTALLAQRQVVFWHPAFVPASLDELPAQSVIVDLALLAQRHLHAVGEPDRAGGAIERRGGVQPSRPAAQAGDGCAALRRRWGRRIVEWDGRGRRRRERAKGAQQPRP